jgi:hypothetical protein
MARIASTRVNTRMNILQNGNCEIYPAILTAATNVTARWIDGTAAGSQAAKSTGWATNSVGASSEAGFDTSIKRSGNASLRLSTLNTSGTISVSSFRTVSIPQLFVLQPSTSYTFVGYIRTNNTAASSAYIDFRQYDSALATLATTASTKFTGTNTFTLVTITLTTNASAAFGAIIPRVNVAGNISDAWFDDMALYRTGTPARVTTTRVQATGRVAS